jgi:hypothetical protein
MTVAPSIDKLQYCLLLRANLSPACSFSYSLYIDTGFSFRFNPFLLTLQMHTVTVLLEGKSLCAVSTNIKTFVGCDFAHVKVIFTLTQVISSQN